MGTLSEELRRNAVRKRYDPERAHRKATVRRKGSKYQGMKVVGDPELRDYVEGKLREDWSPDEIAGRIRYIDGHLTPISAKGIYTFVASPYGRQLQGHLARKGRSPRARAPVKVTKLADRTFIDARPEIVGTRGRFGDWEGDFIVSGKQGRGVLLVLHERRARYTLMRKLIRPTIELVHRALAELTGGLVEVNSLTLDNDIVFRKHRELSGLLGVPIYFCHPYHSWEKGSVENTNKLIRRYVPKGSDISGYAEAYIQWVEDRLNHRPRKCLDYRTPQEVMAVNHQLKIDIRAMLGMMQNEKAPVFGLRG